METLIVVLIVAGAGIFLALRVCRAAGGKSSCACGGSWCGSKDGNTPAVTE